MCVSVYICMCARVYMEAQGGSHVSPSIAATLFLEAGSLTEPAANRLG